MAFGWKLYGDGKTPPMGEAVAPDERLSWPRTVGIGAEHGHHVLGADADGARPREPLVGRYRLSHRGCPAVPVQLPTERHDASSRAPTWLDPVLDAVPLHPEWRSL